MISRSVRAFLLLAFIAGIAALFLRPQVSPAPKGPLVLAASSLQDAMEDAAQAWAAQGHPAPVLSFAASSALARQIVAGAQADLFLSADEEWMDLVERQGLLRPGTRRSFLTNRLVLIERRDGPARTVPAGAAAQLPVLTAGFPLAATLGSGRLALADQQSVPAGKYAQAALQRLGLWDSVRNKIAAAENVRAALALVERGQARLGIVYETDAKAATQTRIVGLMPATSHPPITYPIALLARAQSGDAEGFRAFLLSPQGMAIFRRHGFGVAAEPRTALPAQHPVL